MMAPGLFNDNNDWFDRFFEDPWLGFGAGDMKNPEKRLCGHRAKNVMCTDIKEVENGYEMTVDLPGFEKEEVSIELEKGYLTINAEKSYSNDSEDVKKNECKYIKHERYCGSCHRSFYVGDGITENDIKASFKHGILKLEIPKVEKNEVSDKKTIAIED